MDVGNPSNFKRIRRVFDDDFDKMSSAVSGYWCDDDAIRQHISLEFKRTGYILDPHGAVASLALDNYLARHPLSTGIFIETAHPAKFTDIVEPLVGRAIEMPASLEGFMSGEKQSVVMKPEYHCLEEYLTDRYSL